MLLTYLNPVNGSSATQPSVLKTSLYDEDVSGGIWAEFSMNSPSISKSYVWCSTFPASLPLHYPFTHMYYSVRCSHSLPSPGANLLVGAFWLHLPFKSCRLKLYIFTLTPFLDSVGSMKEPFFCFDEQCCLKFTTGQTPEIFLVIKVVGTQKFLRSMSTKKLYIKKTIAQQIFLFFKSFLHRILAHTLREVKASSALA